MVLKTDFWGLLLSLKSKTDATVRKSPLLSFWFLRQLFWKCRELVSEGIYFLRDTGIIKEERVLLSSLVSPLCPKGGNMCCCYSWSGSTPLPLPKGVFWEHQQPCCCRALEKQKGLALICQAGVYSCVHTDFQQSYEESEQHYGSGGWLRKWSSVKTMAFCHRLTLAAQTKDGVWD